MDICSFKLSEWEFQYKAEKLMKAERKSEVVRRNRIWLTERITGRKTGFQSFNLTGGLQEVKRATTDQGQKKKNLKKKRVCGIHQCAWLCILDPQPPTLFRSRTFKNIAAAHVNVYVWDLPLDPTDRPRSFGRSTRANLKRKTKKNKQISKACWFLIDYKLFLYSFPLQDHGQRSETKKENSKLTLKRNKQSWDLDTAVPSSCLNYQSRLNNLHVPPDNSPPLQSKYHKWH